MTGVIVPDDLPLSRAGVDRAALSRTEDGFVAAALTDDATRVLLVCDGAVVTVAGRGSRCSSRRRSRCRRAEPTTAGSCSVAVRTGETYLARRVPDRRPAPRVGEASDVLVHAAPTDAGPAVDGSCPTGWPGRRCATSART